MKKGTLSTLISITVAVIALIILHQTLYAQVIKPMLFSETKSFSYQKFQELSIKVHDLVDSPAHSSMSEMVFEIEQDYQILSFRPDLDIGVCGDGMETINKPDSCRQEGCLCLFKERKWNKPIECVNLGNTILYNRFYITPKEYLKKQYVTCENPHTQIEEINNIEYNPFSIVGDKSTLIKSFQSSYELLLFRMNSGEEKRVFILKDSDENKLNYKQMNACPSESYERCVNEQYDYVFSKSVEAEEARFVCKFDEIKDKCLKRDITACDNKKISRECSCGNVAYDSGFCVNNVYKPYTLPSLSEYCFATSEYGIARCEDYEADHPKIDIDNEQKSLACNFNVCSLSKGCYWSTRWRDECFDCDCSNDECSIYDNDETRELNPCNCAC